MATTVSVLPRDLTRDSWQLSESQRETDSWGSKAGVWGRRRREATGIFTEKLGLRRSVLGFRGLSGKKWLLSRYPLGTPAPARPSCHVWQGTWAWGGAEGGGGLPPLSVWKVLAKWKWFYKWVYALKVSCPCLLPVILHSMSPHRGPLPEAAPVEKLTIRQGFFSF